MDGNQDFKVLFSCPALGIARNDFMMKIFPQLLKKEYFFSIKAQTKSLDVANFSEKRKKEDCFNVRFLLYYIMGLFFKYRNYSICTPYKFEKGAQRS